jgi:glycosyltransferase involved in cell wall biosynthesis
VFDQHHDVELVLVDDGSTDGSTDIARRFVPPARLIEQANRGSAGAANTGVAHATGDYVAFCDSDDLWTSSRLDVQLAAVAGDPLLDLVFGHADEFLSPELDRASVRTRAPRGVIPAKIPSAALIRRDLFERVGMLDETLRSGAWLSWYAHARESGAHECMLPDVVLRRRLHEHNNFTTEPDAALEYVRALRSLVQNRRDQ